MLNLMAMVSQKKVYVGVFAVESGRFPYDVFSSDLKQLWRLNAGALLLSH